MSAPIVQYQCKCGLFQSAGFCADCLQRKKKVVNAQMVSEIGNMLSIHSTEFPLPPQILGVANHYYRLGLFAHLKRAQMQLDSGNSEIFEKYCKKLMELNDEQFKTLSNTAGKSSDDFSAMRTGFILAYQNIQDSHGFMNEIKLIKLKSLIRAIDNFFNQNNGGNNNE